MVDCMAALNKYAADAVRSLDGVHACTDVTGFSLLGHSYEMCGESGLTVIIDSSRVPLLPGADSYASTGLVPAVAYQNMNHLKDKVALPKDLPSHVHDLLFDPQTSGGPPVQCGIPGSRTYHGSASESLPVPGCYRTCGRTIRPSGHGDLTFFSQKGGRPLIPALQTGSGQPAPFHSATFSTFSKYPYSSTSRPLRNFLTLTLPCPSLFPLI